MPSRRHANAVALLAALWISTAAFANPINMRWLEGVLSSSAGKVVISELNLERKVFQRMTEAEQRAIMNGVEDIRFRFNRRSKWTNDRWGSMIPLTFGERRELARIVDEFTAGQGYRYFRPVEAAAVGGAHDDLLRAGQQAAHPAPPVHAEPPRPATPPAAHSVPAPKPAAPAAGAAVTNAPEGVEIVRRGDLVQARSRFQFENGQAVEFRVYPSGKGVIVLETEQGAKIVARGRLDEIPVSRAAGQITVDGKRFHTALSASQGGGYAALAMDGKSFVLTSKGKLAELKGLDNRLSLKLSAIDDTAGEFAGALVKETGDLYVVSREGNAVRVAFGTRDPALTVRDGILEIDGVRRRIDLRSFEAEARLPARRPTEIKNAMQSGKEGEAVDPVEAVESRYENLSKAIREGSIETYGHVDPDRVRTFRRAFLKRGAKSMVILGPPGTGKTRLVTDVAAQAARGEIPEIPRTWDFVRIDAQSFGAGNNLVGESEQRVLELLEAAKRKPMVLVMDEIHALRGQGTSKGNGNDLFQSLKRPMAEGEIMVVGTSTADEFYAAFSGDRALIERFTTLNLSEPTRAEALKIFGRWAKQQQHPRPAENVLDRVYQLSGEFDAVGAQPRKGLKLLDEVYTELSLTSPGRAPGIGDVERVAAQFYGVDAALFDPALRRQKLLDLRGKLDARIIGQDEAKATLTELAKQAYTRVADPGRPRVLALFAGGRGLGKTELAYAYAESMGLPFKRIEMTKYAAGANPDDLLREISDALQRNAQTVILFDEVEKAGRHAQEALLALTDKGQFTVTTYLDAARTVPQATQVNARNAHLLFTTNAGQDALASGRLTTEQLREAVIADGLSEFLADRLNPVPFRYFTQDQYKDILRMHLARILREQSARHGVRFEARNADEYVRVLAERNFRERASGREVIRMLDRDLRQEITERVLQEQACAAGGVCELVLPL